MGKNKHWRQQQRRKYYIAALKRYASWDSPTWIGDEFVEHPKWIDLYKANELSVYKSVRVPCCYYLCHGERYDRRAFHKETQRILKASDEE